MAKIFDQAQVSKPRMSAFDLSREQKLSCQMGELIPTYLEEVVPGDQFRVRSEIMLRLAPIIAPMMHRVNVYMHYFFVPNRIVWNQWEDFITGGQDGLASPTFPTVQHANLFENRLADYMGLPIAAEFPTATENISALPFRAYSLIWNEYYRDPTLHSEIDVETNALGTIGVLRKRCWEKDYFTSSLPWTQRGAAVKAPIDIQYKDTSELFDTDGDARGNLRILSASATQPGALDATSPHASVSETGRVENLDVGSGIDINDLRRSTALQRWLEKQARGGYRYIETILSHFGVRTEDYRLQRPEYLGGGQQPIVISEVLNTSATATEPQGDMAGHGISVGRTNSFQYQFKEHGYVFGIMSVLPRTAYQQGIMRHWSRNDKYDFYWPELAHLGEQAVLNKELYFDNEDDDYNDAAFGYQQRWAEYKYGCSTVHGDFRSTFDYWHMGRKFANQPALNSAFVEADPTDRIFAVQDGSDTLWVQLFHSVKARRPLPYFSDPRL